MQQQLMPAPWQVLALDGAGIELAIVREICAEQGRDVREVYRGMVWREEGGWEMIGKPCKKCGGVYRNKSHQCISCRKEYNREWRVKNSKSYRASRAKYVASHREQIREYAKKYAHANRVVNHEQVINRERARRNENKAKLNKLARLRFKASSEILSTQYIVHLFLSMGIHLVTPSLIAAKRTHIQILRLLRSINNQQENAT